MPSMLQTRLFVMGQGYYVMENIGYQDNISENFMETNNNDSLSKRNKHMNVCFFVKDKIDKVYVYV